MKLVNNNPQYASDAAAAELASLNRVEASGGAVSDLLKISTPTAAAFGEPLTYDDKQGVRPALLVPQNSSWSRGHDLGQDGASDGDSDEAGVIVEERDEDDVEPEDAPWRRRWRRSIDAVVGSGGLD